MDLVRARVDQKATGFAGAIALLELPDLEHAHVVHTADGLEQRIQI